MKERYDAKTTSNHFKLGDIVAFKRYTLPQGSTPKFAPHWLGTYRVIELDTDAPRATIQPLSDPRAKARTVHFDQIKHHYIPTGRLHITRHNSDSEVQEIEDLPPPENVIERPTPPPRRIRPQLPDPEPFDNDFLNDPEEINFDTRSTHSNSTDNTSDSRQTQSSDQSTRGYRRRERRRQERPINPSLVPASPSRKQRINRKRPSDPSNWRQPDPESQPPPYKTRAGREIHRPQRFRD